MVKTFAGALALAFCATLLAAAKGNTLNAAYLVPGGSVKLDRKAIAAHKFCALTFDDGPDGIYTPQVAKVLAHYKVPATFFVVGQRVSAQRIEQSVRQRFGAHLTLVRPAVND